DLDLPVECLGDDLDGLVGQRLGQRRHLAELHQLLDDLRASEAEGLGDLTDGRAGGDLDRLRLLLDDGSLLDGLFKEGPSAAPATPSRWPLRRRGPHVLAARRLRVDHDATAPLLPGLSSRGRSATALDPDGPNRAAA